MVDIADGYTPAQIDYEYLQKLKSLDDLVKSGTLHREDVAASIASINEWKERELLFVDHSVPNVYTPPPPVEMVIDKSMPSADGSDPELLKPAAGKQPAK